MKLLGASEGTAIEISHNNFSSRGNRKDFSVMMKVPVTWSGTFAHAYVVCVNFTGSFMIVHRVFGCWLVAEDSIPGHVQFIPI